VIFSATRLVLTVLIIGIPPHTLASYFRVTPLLMICSFILSPYFDKSSLLAVTICFPLLIDLRIKSLAGSIPPITSITIFISGSFRISLKFVVKIPSGKTVSLFLFISLTSIFLIFNRHPAAIEAFSFSPFKISQTPVPTVPKPNNAIPISFILPPSLPSSYAELIQFKHGLF